MKSQVSCWPAPRGSRDAAAEEASSRPVRRFSGWWGSTDVDSSPPPRSDSSLKPPGRTVSLLAQGLDLLNLRSNSVQAEAVADAEVSSQHDQLVEETGLSRKSSTTPGPLHERKRSWSITQSLGLGRKIAPQARQLAEKEGPGAVVEAQSPMSFPPPAPPSSIMTDDHEGSPNILDELGFLDTPPGALLIGGGGHGSPLGVAHTQEPMLVNGSVNEKVASAALGGAGGGVHRTQGYRRLWQSITSGGKKGDHSGRVGRHGGEVTVDELVRAVKVGRPANTVIV